MEYKKIQDIEDKKYKLSKQIHYIKNCKSHYTYKYIGFNTLQSLQKYIIQNKQYNHYYQIIDNDICKMYFDIDKCSITENELNDTINKLIGLIDKHYNYKLEYKDFMLEHTEMIDNKYNSLHIIINNVKTEKDNMKRLVLDYNRTYHNESEYFDSKVYDKSRNFKLC